MGVNVHALSVLETSFANVSSTFSVIVALASYQAACGVSSFGWVVFS